MQLETGEKDYGDRANLGNKVTAKITKSMDNTSR